MLLNQNRFQACKPSSSRLRLFDGQWHKCKGHPIRHFLSFQRALQQCFFQPWGTFLPHSVCQWCQELESDPTLYTGSLKLSRRQDKEQVIFIHTTQNYLKWRSSNSCIRCIFSLFVTLGLPLGGLNSLPIYLINHLQLGLGNILNLLFQLQTASLSFVVISELYYTDMHHYAPVYSNHKILKYKLILLFLTPRWCCNNYVDVFATISKTFPVSARLCWVSF